MIGARQMQLPDTNTESLERCITGMLDGLNWPVYHEGPREDLVAKTPMKLQLCPDKLQ
jgi:hypothetical protein